MTVKRARRSCQRGLDSASRPRVRLADRQVASSKTTVEPMAAPILEPQTVIDRPQTMELSDESLAPTYSPEYVEEEPSDLHVERCFDFERRYERRDSLGR